MDSNGIDLRQNNEENIKLLAAQRQIYSDAKQLSVVQFMISTIIPIAVTIIKMFFSSYYTYIAVAVVISSLLIVFDRYVLDKKIKALKEKAAGSQELFDTHVFDLPWNYSKCGQKEDSINNITHYSKKHHKKNSTFDGLIDWYSKEYSFVPIEAGRIMCQRSNISWDTEIRNKFGYFMTFVLFLLSAIILAIACLGNNSCSITILNIFIPVFPLVLYCIKILRENKDTIIKSTLIKQKMDQVWENLLSRKLDREELTKESRKLQDDIFNYRVNAFLILDKFYKCFRDNQEQDMRLTAKEIVKDYEKNSKTKK